MIFKIKKNTKWAILGCIAGVIVMIIFGAISNYYLLLPLYSKFMPMKQIIALCSAVNPNIKGVWTYILYAVVPFNFIKGSIIAVVTLIVYKRLAVVISKIFNRT